MFKERPNRPPSAKEDDDFDCGCRNERHVDDGKNTFLKTPTFTEEEDKEDEDEEQQVSIEDTARLEKIESEDEDARRNILLVVLYSVLNCC